MDPRLQIIDKRLAGVRLVVPVSGGKGGIGKSLVSSTLALTLARLGYKVGLLDLDFSGPSTHVVLGIRDAHPREENGIVPPEVHGIRFLSIIYYAGDSPSPLRGVDISNAIIELLAITQWGQLDYLIIDMPPGIGDTTLDVIRLLKRARFLIVATGSKVVLETVRKSLAILKELSVPIIGVIENMKTNSSTSVSEAVKPFNVPLLGEIEYDRNLEEALGDADKLAKTDFARSLKKILLNTPEFRKD